MITLGNAAKTLGISKSALSKALSRGHLSATKREDGSFAIDPSELARWWEGARHRYQVPAPEDGQPSTPCKNGQNGVQTPEGAAVEVRIRAARLEEQNTALRELLEEVRQDRDLWREQAGEWKEQAKRLMLAAPLVTPPPASAAPLVTPPPAAPRRTPLVTPPPTPMPVPPAPRRASWWKLWKQAS